MECTKNSCLDQLTGLLVTGEGFKQAPQHSCSQAKMGQGLTADDELQIQMILINKSRIYDGQQTFTYI